MSDTDLPNFQTLMRPVLALIEQGHETVTACLPGLQTQFGLSDEAMERLLPSGKKTVMVNRAHWARNYMKHAGLVEPIRRGHYQITPLGKLALAQHPEHINKSVLKTYPAFVDWITPTEGGSTMSDRATSEAADTPEDQMERAFGEIDGALAEELLGLVRGMKSARFERLIVELLVAMGYGGGRTEMGQAIGQSGDGGIDGIVNEDQLGLDAVYIQAKCYAVDRSVGAPDLRDFVGAMVGRRASKGVFVTTSHFTQSARDFIRTVVQQRVVLIDGARLARLMIDHGVGVTVDTTYVLRSVDANFFAPME